MIFNLKNKKIKTQQDFVTPKPNLQILPHQPFNVVRPPIQKTPDICRISFIIYCRLAIFKQISKSCVTIINHRGHIKPQTLTNL